MIRTIYRGYDITSDRVDSWHVWNPQEQGKVLATLKSEEAAQDFIDSHKRRQKQGEKK